MGEPMSLVFKDGIDSNNRLLMLFLTSSRTKTREYRILLSSKLFKWAHYKTYNVTTMSTFR